jgi:UDP-2,3-diacylglucosamine pyrophosphatase LpxH
MGSETPRSAEHPDEARLAATARLMLRSDASKLPREDDTAVGAGRLVLISDIHADEWQCDLPHNAVPRKRARLLEFFDWVVDASGARRLVIAGDLVDLPQSDSEAVLPRFWDIATKLKKVLDAGIELTYVVGNHDCGIVGLDVLLDAPPLRIDYPYILTKSEGKTFLIEHGHLHDPWLWDYERTLLSAMASRTPAHPGPFALAATSEGEAPAFEDVAKQLGEAWHVHREDIRPEHLDALLRAVRADLRTDYSDLMDDTDADMIASRQAIAEKIDKLSAGGAVGPQALGLRAPSVGDAKELLVGVARALYVGPRWRKAARTRAAQMERDPGIRIEGVVMGHTHYADQRQMSVGGRPLQYVNSGTWRDEWADIVLLEGGRLTLHHRKWQDPWPVVP